MDPIDIALPRSDLSGADEVALAAAIEAGLLAADARARHARTDATDTELVLLERAGARALRHLVESNLRLVAMVAKREATRTGVAENDLFQEGCLGLMEAVRRFDHRRGLRFATYALHWIRAAVAAYSATRGGELNLPPGRAQRVRRLRGLQSALAQRLGREPTVAELAAQTGRGTGAVARLLAHRPTAPLDADGRPPQLPDEHAAADFAAVLDRAGPGRDLLADLDGSQRQVIAWRYGFVDGRCHSLQDVSRRLGIPISTVRRTQLRALEVLRCSCPQQAHVDLASA